MMDTFIFVAVCIGLVLLGGKVRTLFLYGMFLICLTVLATVGEGNGVKHFAVWSFNAFVYAYSVALDAQTGSVGLIGKGWWMIRYAAALKISTLWPWTTCLRAARLTVAIFPEWQTNKPVVLLSQQLSNARS